MESGKESWVPIKLGIWFLIPVSKLWGIGQTYSLEPGEMGHAICIVRWLSLRFYN